jgi:hypothetical protein
MSPRSKKTAKLSAKASHKAAKAAAPPSLPLQDSHSSSPELGSPSKLPQYNQQTGRPIRRSAGIAKAVAGYVDSSILQDIDEDDFPQSSSDSSDDDEDDDDQPRGRANKKRKRKRSPSPPSPQLEPILYDQALDDLTDHEAGGALGRMVPKKAPVTLRFDVPLGFHGPLFVKLDSAILKDGGVDKAHGMQSHPSGKLHPTPKPADEATRPRYAGFTDLPPELRNKIYRYLFARKSDNPKRDVFRIPAAHYTIDAPGNLCQSAQFLRTCRLVHDEGCSVLYGENTFCFDRHEDTRGPFWEHEPKEIGYQDVLHFLRMIGPENLQYLRDIKLCFNDARPSDRPGTHSEERRYLSDEILLHCLRILRQAKLRTVHLAFMGRRHLYRSDHKFLAYLEQIKTDELIKWDSPRGYFSGHKIGYNVWAELTDEMVRKKSLYEKK